MNRLKHRSDRNNGNIQISRENALNLSTTSDSVLCESEANCFDKLQNLHLKYPKNEIFGYINIISIRNTFENFSSMIQDHIDILVIAETKLDASFPKNQFLIPGFKAPYRMDVSDKTGGLLVFVRDCLLSTEIKVDNMSPDTQVIPFELNTRKQKWLLLPVYRPPNQNKAFFVEQISKLIDKFGRYDNVLALGDLNMEHNDKNLSPFLDEHNLYNVIKGPTCFKSHQGRCIDLLLTNKKHSFMTTQSFETGFSDHHHLIYTILKSTYNKAPPKKLLYRDYKNWSEECWEMDLEGNLRTSHPVKF